jgi:hypothetical protein
MHSTARHLIAGKQGMDVEARAVPKDWGVFSFPSRSFIHYVPGASFPYVKL